jgi:hypothetical protein
VFWIGGKIYPGNNVHGVRDVRQMYVHIAEPLMPEPSFVKVEIAFGKLKS